MKGFRPPAAKKGDGFKNFRAAHHGGDATEMVHTILVEPTKHPGGDLVEVNKIGQNHLAEGGKKVLCHKLFTFESPYRRKIRRFKTVLVV